MASYTLQEIVYTCFDNTVSIIGDQNIFLEGVCDVAKATPHHISFFANERYLADAKKSAAGVIIMTPESYNSYFALMKKRAYLLHENPTAAFQEILHFFQGRKSPTLTGFQGIHSTAVVHPSATVEEDVTVGPYVVIDENVHIGSGSHLLPHCYIGPGVKIGSHCVIHAHTVIREGCILQDRVIIQPGAIIGSCGFGYSTNKKGEHKKLDHWGNVVLEEDVEIGANTTIDRGRFLVTQISKGTKIDNLVQIAHNVIVGSHCLLVAQSAIAGSAKVGDHVILAGKAAINGHTEICSGVTIAAFSGVTKSITKPGSYSGMPARTSKEHNKNIAYVRKIEDFFQRILRIEQKLHIT